MPRKGQPSSATGAAKRRKKSKPGDQQSHTGNSDSGSALADILASAIKDNPAMREKLVQELHLNTTTNSVKENSLGARENNQRKRKSETNSDSLEKHQNPSKGKRQKQNKPEVSSSSDTDSSDAESPGIVKTQGKQRKTRPQLLLDLLSEGEESTSDSDDDLQGLGIFSNITSSKITKR